mgnify:CR=1 FL=1
MSQVQRRPVAEFFQVFGQQFGAVVVPLGTELAILVGGGPAPGINSVIAAATIRAANEGVEVVGVRDGFKWIMKGRSDRVLELEPAEEELHAGGTGALTAGGQEFPCTLDDFRRGPGRG